MDTRTYIDKSYYNNILSTAKNNTDLLPVEQEIFPIIDPRVRLPNFFPNIEQLKDLGDEPYKVEDNGYDLIVHFPGGSVEYYFSEEYGYHIPSKVEIFGVLTEAGRPALNTNDFNTTVIFSTVHEDEKIKKGDLYYQIVGGPLLKIDVFEGEKEVPKEWWYTDRKN